MSAPATTLRTSAQRAIDAIDAFRNQAGGMPAATGEFAELSAAGVDLGAVLAAPAEPEPSAEAEWRRLALQFDGHRMQALWHLKAMLVDPLAHAEAVKTFLSDGPLSGEQVLAERIAALAQVEPQQTQLAAAPSSKRTESGVNHDRSHERGLLEMAAKAAGYEVLDEFPYQIFVTCGGQNPLDGVDLFGLIISDFGRIRSPWNPLENDADAFRLAVSLGISIERRTTSDGKGGWVKGVSCEDEDLTVYAYEDGDDDAATRRAITRAAADLGEALPSCSTK